jgi:hypothetical protein
MKRTSLVWAVAGLWLTACGGEQAPPEDSGPDTIRTDLPAAPEGGARLVSPVFQVDAASEVFMCMRIEFDVTEDMWVNSSTGYQVEGGHHTMLYYTAEPQVGIDPMPHECAGEDMGNIRFIGVGTANGIGITLPEGIAMKIPKGAEIWTQSHYLNTTGEEITAQDVIDLELIAANEVTDVAAAFTQVDLGLELTPVAETTRVIECTAPQNMTVPFMIPHMHEWGAHFKLEVVRNDETMVIYDQGWEESLRDDFPILSMSPMLELTPNDVIRTTCTWHNDTADPILFPQEMCATFMPFYPSSDGALLACDETGEHFQP